MRSAALPIILVMAYLIIQSGKQKVQAFELDKCPLSAGREVTRDIQVVDPKVSRKHFIVDQDKAAPDTFTIVAVSQKVQQGVDKAQITGLVENSNAPRPQVSVGMF